MKRRKIILTDTKRNPLRKIKTTVVNEVFAVHGTIFSWPGYAYDGKTSVSRKDYTLTHIPTGAAVVQNRTKDTLIRAAKKLMELGNWDFTDPDMATELFDTKRVMAIIDESQIPNLL